MNHNPLQRKKGEIVSFRQGVEEVFVLFEVEDLPALIANKVIMIIPDPVIMHLIFGGDHD